MIMMMRRRGRRRGEGGGREELGPCDFWMFPKLKEKLSGRRFEDVEEMQEAVTSVLDSFHLKDFKGAFQKWLEHYNKCVEAGGSYFEGD